MVAYLGHLDYVPNLMTTFICIFYVLAHSQQVRMKLQIRVKLGINSRKPMSVKLLGSVKCMISIQILLLNVAVIF